MTAWTKIIARMFGYDHDRLFGGIVNEFAQEVFQETYDADLLRRKVEALRREQERIRSRRRHDLRMIDRLERMGQYYDKTHNLDALRKKGQGNKPPTPRVK